MLDPLHPPSGEPRKATSGTDAAAPADDAGHWFIDALRGYLKMTDEWWNEEEYTVRFPNAYLPNEHERALGRMEEDMEDVEPFDEFTGPMEAR